MDQYNNIIDVIVTIVKNGKETKLFMTLSIDNDLNDMYVFLLKVFQHLNDIQLLHLHSLNMRYHNEYNVPEFVRNRNGYFHFKDYSLLFV
jgi:hypothetical protein